MQIPGIGVSFCGMSAQTREALIKNLDAEKEALDIIDKSGAVDVMAVEQPNGSGHNFYVFQPQNFLLGEKRCGQIGQLIPANNTQNSIGINKGGRYYTLQQLAKMCKPE